MLARHELLKGVRVIPAANAEGERRYRIGLRRAAQPRTAKSLRLPGIPFNSCSPRSSRSPSREARQPFTE